MFSDDFQDIKNCIKLFMYFFRFQGLSRCFKQFKLDSKLLRSTPVTLIPITFKIIQKYFGQFQRRPRADLRHKTIFPAFEV